MSTQGANRHKTEFSSAMVPRVMVHINGYNQEQKRIQSLIRGNERTQGGSNKMVVTKQMGWTDKGDSLHQNESRSDKSAMIRVQGYIRMELEDKNIPQQ